MPITGIVNIVLAVMTLVEQGVITATRAKGLIKQGQDEGWDDARWTQELTGLANASDSMFANTQTMLDELHGRV